jgi:hypothetical protein
MTDVFISYSHNNTDIMQRLKKYLKKKNINVWTDEGLEPGTPSWKKAIEKELKDAICLIVLLSPEAKESEWVRRELSYAETYRIPIVPIWVSGDTQESIPIDLIDSQRIDIRENYKAGKSEIFNAIDKYIGSGKKKKEIQKALKDFLGRPKIDIIQIGEINVEKNKDGIMASIHNPTAKKAHSALPSINWTSRRAGYVPLYIKEWQHPYDIASITDHLIEANNILDYEGDYLNNWTNRKFLRSP